MIISIIVAMDELGGIGHHGRVPWRLSTDLKRFKSLTWGHHLIMGRKTYESIGKALPGRTMIVITHNPAYRAEGCILVSSFAQAVKIAEQAGESEVLVIGGGEIYRQALLLADQIYLTRVHVQVPADVFFPELDEKEWIEVTTEFVPQGEKDAYDSTFRILKRT
jgi:dihydrofolate reductase